MPNLNRRNFLQVTGAAALTPALPALPATAARSTVTSAQMLWASLIARAGNASSAAQLANTMGIPNHVARGIFAKLIENKVVIGQAMTGLNRAANPIQTIPNSPAASKAPGQRPLRKHLESLWKEDLTEKPEANATEDRDETPIERERPDDQ